MIPMDRSLLSVLSAILFTGTVGAQGAGEMLAFDEHGLRTESSVDEAPGILEYEALNGGLGGDSVRYCNGYACTGWVEDTYPDGSLKHRGYYDKGQLLIYRNFHADGTLEREFKVVDNTKSVMRTYHPNGKLRSEMRYWNGECFAYTDHYPNGQLRYEEEKHRSEPYYIRMNLFAYDGKPISTLELVDKKPVEFLQREFHANGQVKLEGRVRYNPDRRDSMRVGTWTRFDEQGRPEGEDEYSEGKVFKSREL